MLFFMEFSYTILRNLKETLIIKSVGIEGMIFLKVCGILPFSGLCVLLYAKMSNKFNRIFLFYGTIIFFLLFFFFFLIFFQYKSISDLSNSIILLETNQSYNISTLILSILKYWPCSVFYVVSEMWGGMLYSILFWQFANDIFNEKQASKNYPLFSFYSNFASIGAGIFTILSSKLIFFLFSTKEEFMLTSSLTLMVIILCGIVICLCFHKMIKLLGSDFLHQKNYLNKLKLPLKEGIKLVFTNPQLFYIALGVFTYNSTFNLIEILYKSEMNSLIQSSNDYITCIGYISIFLGLLSCVITFSASYIIPKVGWFKSALIPPIILLSLAIIFFTFLHLKKYLGEIALWGGIVSGVCYTSSNKALKDAFWGPTKEIAYISLYLEAKVKGKAVIDGWIGKIGKSFGAVVQQASIIQYGKIMASILVIEGFLYVAIVIWIFSIVKLYKTLKMTDVILTQKENSNNHVTLGDSSQDNLQSNNDKSVITT